MRVKGMRMDGSIRYRHRVGYGCQARPNFVLVDEQSPQTTAIDVRSDAFDQEFHDEGRGYNLVALWRAKGRPASRAPRYWFATEEGRAWLNSVPDAVSVAQGAQGGTWIDDIQAALQYAAYLDPALREDIYDVYVRSKLEKSQAGKQYLDVPHDFYAANGTNHAKTHKMLEDLQRELRGSIVYKDRILVIRGSVYFIRLWPEMPLELVGQLIEIPEAAEMWRRGYRLYKVGMTGKQQASSRLEGYAKELRAKPPQPIAEIHVDNPELAERILKKRNPHGTHLAKGCSEHFWCKPDIEDRVRRSWAKHPNMAVSDLELQMHGWEIGAPVRVVQEQLSLE